MSTWPIWNCPLTADRCTKSCVSECADRLAAASPDRPAPDERYISGGLAFAAEMRRRFDVPAVDVLDTIEREWQARAAHCAQPAVTEQESVWLTLGEEMHPLTKNLVVRFARALAKKLAAAEAKYGYSNGWAETDWMDECRQKLREHIAKGDPRDVAAYCAFLWHHGESTAPPQPPAQEPVAIAHRRGKNLNGELWLEITGEGHHLPHGAKLYAAPVAQPPAEDITYWRKRALQAEQSASDHLQELEAAQESEPPAEWVDAARIVMGKHDREAVRCNFSHCGCDWCDALRAHLTAGGKNG